MNAVNDSTLEEVHKRNDLKSFSRYPAILETAALDRTDSYQRTERNQRTKRKCVNQRTKRKCVNALVRYNPNHMLKEE